MKSAMPIHAQHFRRRVSYFRGRGFRGLTLIELLAVVVIISLVASVSLVSLAAGGESARLRATASAWRDLDAHARLLAQSQGALIMELSADQTSVMLRAVAASDQDDPEKAIHFPDGVTAELVDSDGHSSASVQYDRLGRSSSYNATLRNESEAITWRANGLTGLVTITASEAP